MTMANYGHCHREPVSTLEGKILAVQAQRSDFSQREQPHMGSSSGTLQLLVDHCLLP